MNPSICSRCGLFHASTARCLALTVPVNPGAADLAPGSLHAGRYRIVRLLHHGGMSTIYLAEDTKLQGRAIALKELRLPHGASPAETREAEAWFARESAWLSVLRHPLIPMFYSVFREGDRSYIAQEFVPGENLDELINRQGPIEPDAAVAWAVALCQLLEYLHGLPEPVVFRDLKPANILLRATWSAPERRLAVVDFGIARSIDAGTVGTVIGTPGYAAPEQYQGLATPQSDIYALGATLHRLLSGYDAEHGPPFAFPALRSLAPAVSERLEAVVRRATALNPADRYQSACELRVALQASIPAAQRPAVRARRMNARSPQRAMLAVAALLVLPLLLTQMLLRAASGGPYYYESPQGYSASGTYQLTTLNPATQTRTAVGPTMPGGTIYAQCNLTTAQFTRPRTDFTCDANRDVWFIDGPNNELDRVQKDGSVSQFAIPAPASMFNSITAGPGGSPDAAALWLTGASNAVLYVGLDGQFQIRRVAGSSVIAPLGTTQDGSLRFVDPHNGQSGLILPDGTVRRAALGGSTHAAPITSRPGAQ